MAVAFDAFSRPGTGTGVTDDSSWTHTPVGTPTRVLVYVIGPSASSFLNGVTYGGNSLAHVTGSPLIKASTEVGQVHLLELTSSVPSGAQTVAVDVTSGAFPYSAGCITLTGTGLTNADIDVSISANSQADPSVTLSLGGNSGFCVIGFVSGQNAVTGITPLTDWTAQSEEDLGAITAGIYTYDIIGSSDVTAGWTQTADDAIAIAIAVTEPSANSGPTISPDTADAATLTPLATIEFTGSDADSDDLEYEIDITDNPAGFTGGSVLTEEQADGDGSGNLVIHPGPTGATTWEGHRQIDDRVGQVLQASGGRLDAVHFYFGAHESTPADTDGDYLVTLYAVDSGVRGDSTIAPWAATTAYSQGDLVKQTSTANANQQFLYVCTTAGTSGGTEPTWTEVEDDTINDNTVVWTAHRGAGPLNPAAAADTPTPGWLARSGTTAFAPGVSTVDWRASTFSGSQRIRLAPGQWYVAVLDWRPSSSDLTNTLTVNVRQGSGHNGNCYLDGAETTNNGPRVGDDAWVRLYESFTLISRNSTTHSSEFVNTVSGGDTSPFNAGQKIRYTVPVADALEPGVTYYWRARVKDPSGTNTWSSYTTTRSFTVSATQPGTIQPPRQAVVRANFH